MSTKTPRALSVPTLAAGALLALGVLTTSVAVAQPAAYAGPSTVPTATVKQLLDTGRDDQKAILRGRIVSHDGGDDYTFEDATGRISVDIDRDKFPTTKIDGSTEVELIGEFEREGNKVEFDVDQVRIP